MVRLNKYAELALESVRIYQGGARSPLRPLSLIEQRMIQPTEDRVTLAYDSECVGGTMSHWGLRPTFNISDRLLNG